MKTKLLIALLATGVCATSIAQADSVTLALGFSKRPTQCEYKIPNHDFQPCKNFHMMELYGFKHGLLVMPKNEVQIPSSLLIGYRDGAACHIAFHTFKETPYLIGSTDPRVLECRQESDRTFSLKKVR